MKKIKTYLVIKDNPTLDTIEIYYVGKSKRLAKKVFVDKATYFFQRAFADDVKIRFLKVWLPDGDYLYLKDYWDDPFNQDTVNWVVNNIWYGTDWLELCMINNLTFDLDFLPYFCRKTGINPLDLQIEGVLEKLLSGKDIWVWVKRYLRNNF